MKKRNTTIFAFLLLAAVGMGVGYAALTDSLNLEGTANADTLQAAKDWEEDVHFHNAIIAQSTTNGTATASLSLSDNDDTASITVSGLENKGETIVVTLRIMNDNPNYDAQLDAGSLTVTPTAPAKASDFTVSVDNLDNVLVGKGGYTDFKVTIVLNVQPTVDLSAYFVIGYTATAVDPR